MVHDLVFALDNCCTDTMCLKEGGFIEPTVIGDVYHISTVTSEKKSLVGFFASDLRKCFGSRKPGVFWLGEKIISAIEQVKAKYQRGDIALWNSATTKCFENEKTYYELSSLLFHRLDISFI
jgi:hypothetical protein